MRGGRGRQLGRVLFIGRSLDSRLVGESPILGPFLICERNRDDTRRRVDRNQDAFLVEYRRERRRAVDNDVNRTLSCNLVSHRYILP
jgi:hypothetical protein